MPEYEEQVEQAQQRAQGQIPLPTHGEGGAAPPSGPQANEWWRRPSPDPYSIQWDPNTFRPTGQQGSPRGPWSIHYQFRAEQLAEEARQRFFRDALGANQQALGTLASFRPGGSAGMASGVLQNRAGLLFNIGTQQEAPDMLLDLRRHETKVAEHKARNAQLMNFGMSILGAGASVAGAALAGPAGAAAGASLMPPAGPTTPAGQPSAAAQIGPTTPGAGAAPATLMAPIPNDGLGAPQTWAEAQAQGGAGNRALPASVGPPQGVGAPPPAGGPVGQDQPPHGPSVGGPAGAAVGGAGGAAGGYGTDGQFGSLALASRAAAAAPALTPVATLQHADEVRPGGEVETWWRGFSHALTDIALRASELAAAR